MNITDGKTVTIKGDFATTAKKIEIKDNANTVFTTYISENAKGEVKPHADISSRLLFLCENYFTACHNDPCSNPTSITLAEAAKGQAVTLEKGFTKVVYSTK